MDTLTGRVEVRDRPRVVVGVDGSPGARAALAWALQAASARGAALEVVATYPVDHHWTDAHVLEDLRVDAVRAHTEARTRDMVAQLQSDPAATGTESTPVDVIV